jgi:hypothetical protein
LAAAKGWVCRALSATLLSPWYRYVVDDGCASRGVVKAVMQTDEAREVKNKS